MCLEMDMQFVLTELLKCVCSVYNYIIVDVVMKTSRWITNFQVLEMVDGRKQNMKIHKAFSNDCSSTREKKEDRYS